MPSSFFFFFFRQPKDLAVAPHLFSATSSSLPGVYIQHTAQILVTPWTSSKPTNSSRSFFFGLFSLFLSPSFSFSALHGRSVLLLVGPFFLSLPSSVSCRLSDISFHPVPTFFLSFSLFCLRRLLSFTSLFLLLSLHRSLRWDFSSSLCSRVILLVLASKEREKNSPLLPFSRFSSQTSSGVKSAACLPLCLLRSVLKVFSFFPRLIANKTFSSSLSVLFNALLC